MNRTNSAQVGPHELRAQADHIEKTTDLKGTALLLRETADTIESLQADRELALARLSESKDKVKALQAEVEALKQVNAVRFRQLDCLTNGNAEQGCGHVH